MSDYHAVAFWRTQVSLWPGGSHPRLSGERLKLHLRCVVLALSVCQGTVQSLGFQAHFE